MDTQNKQRRVALVTGASQGLGAAIAVRLARDGYDVAVTELTEAPLAGVVDRLKALGARAVPLALDIRSQPSVITSAPSSSIAATASRTAASTTSEVSPR